MTSSNLVSLFMSDDMNNNYSDSKDDSEQSHFRIKQHEVSSGTWTDMIIRHKEKNKCVSESAPLDLVSLIMSQGEFLLWTSETNKFFNKWWKKFSLWDIDTVRKISNHKHSIFDNSNHKAENWKTWQEDCYKKTDKPVMIYKDCDRCLAHSALSCDENSSMIYHWEQQCVKFNWQSTIKKIFAKVSCQICYLLISLILCQGCKKSRS